MEISSPSFGDGDVIPAQFTCDGADSSPTFTFSDLPEGTSSLALIVDDPDSPRENWVHWTVWNIPPGDGMIAESALPGSAVEGTNDFGRVGWGGPCPQSGTHRYRFHLYALDQLLDLASGASRADLEAAMAGNIRAEAELTGLYSRAIPLPGTA